MYKETQEKFRLKKRVFYKNIKILNLKMVVYLKIYSFAYDNYGCTITLATLINFSIRLKSKTFKYHKIFIAFSIYDIYNLNMVFTIEIKKKYIFISLNLKTINKY